METSRRTLVHACEALLVVHEEQVKGTFRVHLILVSVVFWLLLRTRISLQLVRWLKEADPKVWGETIRLGQDVRLPVTQPTG